MSSACPASKPWVSRRASTSFVVGCLIVIAIVTAVALWVFWDRSWDLKACLVGASLIAAFFVVLAACTPSEKMRDDE
jgi:hypothetical protein